MMTGRTVAVTALLTLAGLGVISCSSDEKNVGADVRVTACTPDPAGGRPSAQGRITNNSSKDSAYAFRVSFIDTAGNKVSEGAVAVADVEAGGNAMWRTQGATDAKGRLTCSVSDVSRTAVQ